MAKVTVSIDAELAVEVMVLAGVKSPQDAVEPAVRDLIARGHPHRHGGWKLWSE
ncbi:type II toxin-antitoxin system VapB family antitoxin [Streptomyces sp. CBG9]|uniref:type II toxin-antitoxin system VapB family antitoxin n=1 Tax=Streptomyces sp. CBG9 TaxID=2762622 RepID=UPI0016466CF6